jgi:spore coat protein A, manganese oxidase
MLTRRRFLKLSAAGAGLLLPLRPHWVPQGGPGAVGVAEAAPLNPVMLSKYTEQLPIPLVKNTTAGGSLSLLMAPSSHQFHAQLPPTPTWGYAGATYLGPTFEARRGNPVQITWTNSLGSHLLAGNIDTTLHGATTADKTRPRASVHLHGGNTEPGSDGHPADTFTPGQKHRYTYANDQEPTTLWYHDHALGITRLNVYAGLAGFYLLRDDRDTGQSGNPIGLPAGQYEVPLVIQDKMFDPDGSLLYPQAVAMPGQDPRVPPGWIPEFFGDVAVVNGKVWPNLNVNQGLYRFRVLNGSNARFYQLTLSNGQPMYQIGTDGGLLNAPVEIGQLVIGPGERADVLIDFSSVAAGTAIQLTNSAPVPFPNGPHAMHKGGVPLKEIMQFTVGAAVAPKLAIPGSLRTQPIAALANPIKVRNLTLVEVLDQATGQPIKALLNNLPWEAPSSMWEQPKVDTVERWNIINTTGDAHPIHLHLAQFQVLGRQSFDAAAFLAAKYPTLPDPDGMESGPWPAPSAEAYAKGTLQKPAANVAGWKDTVQALPGQITRLVVPFGGNVLGAPFGQSFTGDYVWHCHILEHEDNEMMLPYRITK